MWNAGGGGGGGVSNPWTQQQGMSFNQNHYAHLPHDQVDWAALAQQWIQMKESSGGVPHGEDQLRPTGQPNLGMSHPLGVAPMIATAPPIVPSFPLHLPPGHLQASNTQIIMTDKMTFGMPPTHPTVPLMTNLDYARFQFPSHQPPPHFPHSIPDGITPQLQTNNASQQRDILEEAPMELEPLDSDTTPASAELPPAGPNPWIQHLQQSSTSNTPSPPAPQQWVQSGPNNHKWTSQHSSTLQPESQSLHNQDGYPSNQNWNANLENFAADQESHQEQNYSNMYWSKTDAAVSNALYPYQHSDSDENSMPDLDAAKRRALPAWIREGLEKVEREKRRQQEKEKLAHQKAEDRKQRQTENQNAEKTESRNIKTNNGWANIESNEKEDSEDDQEEEIDRQKNFSPPRSRSPLSISLRHPPPQISSKQRLQYLLSKCSEEEKLKHVMLSVRNQLTGLLLEVTNQELYHVASETLQHAKSKKVATTSLRKLGALASLTGGPIGLGIGYGSNSDTEESNSGSDSDDDNSSEVELKMELERKHRRWEIRKLELMEGLESSSQTQIPSRVTQQLRRSPTGREQRSRSPSSGRGGQQEQTDRRGNRRSSSSSSNSSTKSTNREVDKAKKRNIDPAGKLGKDMIEDRKADEKHISSGKPLSSNRKSKSKSPGGERNRNRSRSTSRKRKSRSVSEDRSSVARGRKRKSRSRSGDRNSLSRSKRGRRSKSRDRAKNRRRSRSNSYDHKRRRSRSKSKESSRRKSRSKSKERIRRRSRSKSNEGTRRRSRSKSKDRNRVRDRRSTSRSGSSRSSSTNRWRRRDRPRKSKSPSRKRGRSSSRSRRRSVEKRDGSASPVRQSRSHSKDDKNESRTSRKSREKKRKNSSSRSRSKSKERRRKRSSSSNDESRRSSKDKKKKKKSKKAKH